MLAKLYNLKEQGTEHLKAGHYMHSSVYFKDILEKFDLAIQTITNEDQMQLAIRELQLSAHKNLSLCFLKLGKYALSLKQSQVVLDIQPHNVKMLFRAGSALMQLRRLQEAEKYLRQGFALDPHEKEIMKALQEIQKQKQQLRNENVTKQQGFVMRLIIALLEILFWFPLLVYRKGKAWAIDALQDRQKQQ